MLSVVYCHTCRGRVSVDVDCDDPTHDHEPPGRVVVWCETCSGHAGIEGSLGEHCADGTHDRRVERWDTTTARFWGRYYAREARSAKVRAEAEAERLSTPLLTRLRACGVRPATDGAMSILPPDIDDAHDAADVIDALVEVAQRLADGDDAVRAAARAELAAIRTRATTGEAIP